MRMYGLTGNIGSGKSAVARMLVEAGVPVIDADRIAREVVEPGTAALGEIAARFPGVVRDGALDRKALAARVFASADELAALNAVVHPRIAQAVSERSAQLAGAGAPFAVYEAALLVENKLHHGALDGLIVVTAPPEVLLQRVRARDGATEAEARARLAAQLPQEQKVALADFVIDNAGTLPELQAQVDALLARLRTGSLRGHP